MSTLAFDVFARDKASPVLDKVGANVDQTSGKFSRFKAAAAAGAAVAGAAIVKFGIDSIKAASDLGETMNKSSVIFGSSAGQINSWASGAAKSMGMSKRAAMESAAGFGDMFLQLGFAQEQAVKMSTGVVKLSADLGSFNNLPTAEVSEMIAAAFRGEYDSLQRLIPNINAARVEKEALTMTGKKSAKELTAQEKAAATLAIVQKDGARAAGDFARTQDGLANQTKIASARFEDLQATVGQRLVPVVSTLLAKGLELADWLGENPGKVKAVAIGFGVLTAALVVGKVAIMAHTAALAIGAAGGLAKWAASTKIAAAGQWLLNAALTANPIGLVILAIVALGAALVVAYKKSDTFRAFVQKAFNLTEIAAWGLAYGAVTAFKFMINMWLTVVGAVVSGAAKAFGWVPGLGPKLKTAAANMETFKNNTNRSLDKVQKDLKVKLDTALAQRNALNLKAQMDKIKSKTVTVHVVTKMTSPGGGRYTTGGTTAFAKGGRPPVGEPYLVGEEGPELRIDDKPGVIIDAQTTARMLARGRSADDSAPGGAGGSDRPVVIQLVLDGRVIQQSLLKLKRQGGVELGLT